MAFSQVPNDLPPSSIHTIVHGWHTAYRHTASPKPSESHASLRSRLLHHPAMLWRVSLRGHLQGGRCGWRWRRPGRSDRRKDCRRRYRRPEPQ
jgi:hypothetical protein